MKLAVVGAGKIAQQVVENTLSKMKEITLYAVGSRSIQKAEEFKNKFGFEKAYGSYEELSNDKEIDLVYLCTPHSEHFENMKLFLNKKLNVFCEKSFTLNAKQAQEVVDLARKNNVFLAEAIWPRYKYITKKITQTINSGIIGKVNVLNANLFYPVISRERLSNLSLGGGALLDVGIYPINFALTHFGYDIDKIEVATKFASTGVDESDSITIFYKDGRLANLTCGINSKSDRMGIFYGDKGYMVVDNVNLPSKFEVFDTDHKLIEKFEEPNLISGYEYEFKECVECLLNKQTESDKMPLDETVKVMTVMDSIRRKANIKFPQE